MEILIAQIEALIQDLARTQDLLVSTQVERYTRPVRAKFYSYINSTKSDSEDLRDALSKSEVTIAEAWQRFAELRAKGQRSFDQCLEILGGIAIRHMQLEKGICEIAEALAREVYSGIVNWGSVMILGDERPIDDLTENTQIIRLRFPELDIWSLALTAYEFGQLVARSNVPGVASELKNFVVDQERVVKTLIEGENAEDLSKDFVEYWQIHRENSPSGRIPAEEREFLSRQPTHIRTFFADMFATYVLGPAYIYSRIHVLLVPDEMQRSGLYKPTLIRRFHFMLRTLTEMNKATQREKYEEGIYSSEIKRFDSMLEGIKTALTVDASEIEFRKPHDAWFTGLYGKLRRNLEGFRPKQWENARSLSNELLKDSPRVLAGTDLTAVLNAAWLCRMLNPTRLPAIENSAVRLCRDLGSSGPHPTGLAMGSPTQPAGSSQKSTATPTPPR
jgi:hypothetical protein